MITSEQLKDIAPFAKQKAIDEFLPFLNQFMPIYEIVLVKPAAGFLANLAHESGSFKYMQEIWGPTKQQLKYERNFKHAWPPTKEDPVNRVASSLGNYKAGDGKFFSGHGPIQTSGRSNHAEVSKIIFKDNRLLKTPELLATPEYGVQAACIFWQSRGLNEIMSKPDDKMYTIIRINKPTLHLPPFDYACYKVNGGFFGLKERQAFYKRAMEVLNVQSTEEKENQNV